MKKAVITAVALTLALCLAVGGTLAYLTMKTQTVTNTFTAGNVDITLTEETGAEYKMVPGDEIAKDPKVTVEAGSEACWVFVKVVDNAASTYLDYTIDNKWTKLDGFEGVYYIKQADLSGEGAEDAVYPVLTGNKVTVKDSVTKEQMNALQATGATLPTLEFTAYAIQQLKFDTPAAAWAEVSKLG